MAQLDISRFCEFMKCPLCLNIFHNPRLLPCGHKFCEGCIKLHTNYKLMNSKCPTCDKRYKLSDLDKCFKDYNNELQSAAMKQYVATKLCTICSLSNPEKSSGVVTATCINCRFLLCEECIEVHNSRTREHHVIILDKYVKQFCTTHHEHLLDMICNDCEKRICLKCSYSVKHNSHKITLSDEWSGKIKTDLESLVAKLSVVLEKFFLYKSTKNAVQLAANMRLETLPKEDHKGRDIVQRNCDSLITELRTYFHGEIYENEKIAHNINTCMKQLVSLARKRHAVLPKSFKSIKQQTEEGLRLLAKSGSTEILPKFCHNGTSASYDIGFLQRSND